LTGIILFLGIDAYFYFYNVIIMNRYLKIVHWTPRILCILAILFVSMFALDAFDPKLSLGEQLLNFFMHMIPSFVLTAFLIVGWKWPEAGGIIFLIIGLLASPWLFMHNYAMNDSVWASLEVVALISLPFVLVGLLFLWDHRIRKRAEI